MKKKKKHKIRDTSVKAFVEILEDLGLREMQVFQAIHSIQPCSDKMIAKYLNWKINCVTGRRNTLSEFNVIRLVKKDIDLEPPFKKVRFYAIANSNNALLETTRLPQIVK